VYDISNLRVNDQLMFVKKQVFVPVTTAFKNVSTSITQLQITITEDQLFTIHVSIYFNINRHYDTKRIVTAMKIQYHPLP
jgi:hypothetical protein